MSLEVPLEPATAWDSFLEELLAALTRRGIRIESMPGGQVFQEEAVLGRVVEWVPAERIVLEWRPASWEPEQSSEVELRAERVQGATRLTVEQRGLAGVIGQQGELAGWFAAEVAAPFLRATAPAALGDWITDRHARRPSGAQWRDVYRDPLYHYPNFLVILAELALTPDDYLLEVACGGGALLKMALRSGCRAAAVDHSPDMVRVAREENQQAIAAGRLEVLEAAAEVLPFADGVFTCATMTGVLGFLPDPLASLKEMQRVLAPGGRVVIMGADPENRGTPAAPEPMASRLRFYDDEDLENLGRAAGFDSVRAVRRDLEQHARASGVPEEHVPLFAGPGTRFLLARKA